MKTSRASIVCIAMAALLLGAHTSAIAGRVIDLSVQPVPTLVGTQNDEQLGFSCAVADLDGDGVDELIVGAPGHNDPVLGPHAGAVYVVNRRALDNLTSPTSVADVAMAIIPGARERGRFGATLVAGDFNGDGVDDIAVGAPAAGEEGVLSRGALAIFFGGADRRWGIEGMSGPDLVVDGADAGGRLGAALVAADVDSDGLDDLLVAAPWAGSGLPGPGVVYVIPGDSLSAHSGSAAIPGLCAAGIEGEEPGDSLAGIAVADLDGDGRSELILGAHQADGPDDEWIDAGKLYIVALDETARLRSIRLGPQGAVIVPGPIDRGFFGRWVSAGDIDYDGADDLLVSAYASRVEQQKIEASGEAFVLFGAPGGMAPPNLASSEVPRFHSRARWDLFGYPVLLADVDGDAADDVIVAAQFADGPDDDREACGEIYVFRGSLRSVMSAKAGTAELADVTIVGPDESHSVGGSLVVADAVGERSVDLVAGAPDAPGASAETEPRRGRVFVVPGELLKR